MSRADNTASRRAATATLASQIADDAIAVVELLTNLIGAGASHSCELAAARVQLARMGMLADHLRRAHGGRDPGWYRDPTHWVLVSGASTACADAWDSLQERRVHQPRQVEAETPPAIQ